MDKEMLISICVVIGVALVMFGGAKFVRAWIKGEKEANKRK